MLITLESDFTLTESPTQNSNNSKQLNKKEFLKNVKTKLKELREYVEKNAEYVGDKFVSEVRAIHYDKKKKRNIYGTASLEQTNELKEEGIEVQTIPWVEKENA